jgi:GDP-D-mannose dehydratase
MLAKLKARKNENEKSEFIEPNEGEGHPEAKMRTADSKAGGLITNRLSIILNGDSLFGSLLSRFLLKKGHMVQIATANKYWTHRTPAEADEQDRLLYHQQDLSDPMKLLEYLQASIRGVGGDSPRVHIFYLTGELGEMRTEGACHPSYRDLAEEISGKFLNLLEAIRILGSNKVHLFWGTRSFHEPSGLLVTEKTPMPPRGSFKSIGETTCLQYADYYRDAHGLNITTGVYFNLLHAEKKDLNVELLDGMDAFAPVHKYLEDYLRAEALEKPGMRPIQMYFQQHAERTEDIIHIFDLVTAVYHTTCEVKLGSHYIYSSGTNIPFKKYVSDLFAACNLELVWEDDKALVRKSGEGDGAILAVLEYNPYVTKLRGDNSKLTGCGWSPSYDYKKMINEFSEQIMLSVSLSIGGLG